MDDDAARAGAARDALAEVERVRSAAEHAARRSLRLRFLATGAGFAVAVLAGGLLSRWGGAQPSWLRAAGLGVIWAAAVGGALALLGSTAVRAAPVRRQAVTLILAGAVVIGLAMAAGHDAWVWYPVGAVAVAAVWAVGAARVRPRG
jgi:hypothetical protein